MGSIKSRWKGPAALARTPPRARRAATRDTEEKIMEETSGISDIQGSALSTAGTLSQAKAIGQGFNVYGTYDAYGLTRPLANPAKAQTHTFVLNGNEYQVPDYVEGVESHDSEILKIVGEDREDIQEQISAHAGLSASYGAFSGEVKADFDFSRKSSTESYYCYWRQALRMALLETNPDAAKAALSDDFVRDVEKLPAGFTEATRSTFYTFFARYGPFYVRSATLGGRLTLCNQVAKSEHLTSITLKAALSAHFNKVATGSVDAAMEASATWKAYRQESVASIRCMGGDQVLISKLGGLDPWTGGKESAELVSQWTESLAVQPALFDFKLAGIWELVDDPDRAQAVQDAWQGYSRVMRPSARIGSWSRELHWPDVDRSRPRPPVVVVNGTAVEPDAPPDSPAGVQLVVLSGSDPLAADGIRLDRYYSLRRERVWFDAYVDLWKQVATDIKAHQKAGDVVLLVTYGWSSNMPPTDDAVRQLRTAGSGKVLDHWIDTCDPGSQSGNSVSWMEHPCVFTFVGVFGGERDDAVEVVRRDWSQPVASQADVYLYREALHGIYSPALG
ncbi:MAC/perforin domain-containing protein [Kitasatospora sp. NPDC048538]|uniref:MAC/perforin domain-containing protein n=1 Tax=unclassified Kitasatospora TaxID=2633591 RepID=UPI0033D38339